VAVRTNDIAFFNLGDDFRKVGLRSVSREPRRNLKLFLDAWSVIEIHHVEWVTLFAVGTWSIFKFANPLFAS
jgi:hypothetical protein